MKILKVLPAILLLGSCSPVLYSPSTQNVPLLEQKGEANIGGGLVFNEDSEGISLNFAIAVDSGWAIAGAFNSLSEGNDNDWESRGNYFEGAVGKFGTLKQGPFVYEVFLGLGYGAAKNERAHNSVNGNFVKPYLQPSIGIRSKIVHFAFTPRIGLVSYLSDQVNIFDDPQEEISARNFFQDKGTSVVFEPGITLRLGLENIKLHFQFVYTTFSYQSESIFDYYRNIMNVGLNFYIR